MVEPDTPLIEVREPHLFRFSVRRLLLGASLVVVLCGVLRMTPRAVAGSGLALGALIVAHFFGAAVGHRLRETSQQAHQWNVSRGIDPPLDAPPRGAVAKPRPRATPLAGHDASSSRRGVWAGLVGGMLGSVVGLAGIAAMGGNEVRPLGIAITAVSCGVLAAWIALLASGFWAVGRHAWKDASRSDTPPRRR